MVIKAWEKAGILACLDPAGDLLRGAHQLHREGKLFPSMDPPLEEDGEEAPSPRDFDEEDDAAAADLLARIKEDRALPASQRPPLPAGIFAKGAGTDWGSRMAAVGAAAAARQ